MKPNAVSFPAEILVRTFWSSTPSGDKLVCAVPPSSTSPPSSVLTSGRPCPPWPNVGCSRS
eukprot:781284-Pyramimonas_sp.AAC.1